MIKKLNRLIAYFLTAALVFCACAAYGFADGDDEREKPTTVICTSDILMSAGTFEAARESRLRLYQFCRTLAENGGADAMVIGGDITAETMPESAWKYCTKQLSEVFSEASDTVLYLAGNRDYYAGEEDGFNSADYIGTSMAERLGELYAWDVYRETIKGEEYSLAYRYYIGGVYFYFLNTAPTDMAGALRYGNFVYTQGAISWIETKMKVDDPNGDALIFLAAHFPLEGAGNESGAVESSISERLTDICSQHINLIYLYSNSNAASSDTEEKVINYTTDGLVLTDSVQEGITLSSVWTFIPTGAETYAVRNLANGRYLTVENGNQLGLTDEVSAWNVKTDNGRIMLLAEDGVNGVRLPKNGAASFGLGQATYLELYARSTDRNGTIYTYADSIEYGGDYVIASDSKYVMSSTVAGSGLRAIEARVMGDLLAETERKTTEEGDRGFTSVYMGSAAGINGIQYLSIDIYSDRVELSLNNYGQDGTVSTLTPYVRTLATLPDGIPPLGGGGGAGKADAFNMRLYLYVLTGAAFGGCLIGVVATVLVRKKRFFE